MVRNQQSFQCSEIGFPVFVDEEEAGRCSSHGEAQCLENVEAGMLLDEVVQLSEPFVQTVEFSCWIEPEIGTAGQRDPSVRLDVQRTLSCGLWEERLGQCLALHSLFHGAVPEAGRPEFKKRWTVRLGEKNGGQEARPEKEGCTPEWPHRQSRLNW